jgi:hypothetical protein
VSNVPHPYDGYSGSISTTATGAIGIYDERHYGFEVSIPADWYMYTGGVVYVTEITGAVCTGTGHAGVFGSALDTLNNGSGYLILPTIDILTGTTTVAIFIPPVRLIFSDLR